MPQRTYARALDDVTDRLHDEFGTLSRACVALCVSDTGRCLENLGYDLTPPLVERLARERLHAVLNSTPPSGLVTHGDLGYREPPHAPAPTAEAGYT